MGKLDAATAIAMLIRSPQLNNMPTQSGFDILRPGYEVQSQNCAAASVITSGHGRGEQKIEWLLAGGSL
ncbi:MAG: hypothetical protein ACT6RL_22020 [Neoaquamicrobium sediminum]|uniref:hypothetical protein n=1 Tax=Neoaquamicrobium sediminum TaxID=1849104 RepID=UPI004037C218